MSPANLLAALTYASLYGFAVFPLHGKIPYHGTHGFKDATKDPKTITDFWNAFPSANIGIATGAVSGIDVIDIDPRHDGLNGFRALAQGKLLTPTVKSGGNGYHLYIQHTGVTWPQQIMPGVDMPRCVVAAPSVHPETHRRYLWLANRHIKNTPIADPPDWLLEHRIIEKPKGVAQPASDEIMAFILEQMDLKPDRRGEWWGLCPAHEDHHARNFSVNFEKGVYHCRACGSSGTVRQLKFQLSKNREGNDNPQTARVEFYHHRQ